MRLILVVAGLMGAVMFAFAAAGANGVGSGNEDAAGWLETASVIGLLHTATLLGVVALMALTGSREKAGSRSLLGRLWLWLAAGAFMLGLVLFPLILGIRALWDWHALAPAAPIGGVALIVGWLCLAVFGLLWRRA